MRFDSSSPDFIPAATQLAEQPCGVRDINIVTPSAELHRQQLHHGKPTNANPPSLHHQNSFRNGCDKPFRGVVKPVIRPTSLPSDRRHIETDFISIDMIRDDSVQIPSSEARTELQNHDPATNHEQLNRLSRRSCQFPSRFNASTRPARSRRAIAQNCTIASQKLLGRPGPLLAAARRAESLRQTNITFPTHSH